MPPEESSMRNRARLAVVLFFATAVSAPLAFSGSMPDGRMRKTPLENFVLHSEFEISKQDLLDVRRHLANARRNVGRDFSFYPKKNYDVILVTSKTFHSYITAPEQVVGLFDGSIHIPLPSIARNERFVMSVLWHEYTHAVTAELSKNRCPIWLSEGFAVYQENSITPSDLKYVRAAYALKPGRLPIPLSGMEAAVNALSTKDPETVSVAYEQAYLFADYLFARYTRSHINQFLRQLGRGQTLEEALGEVFHITPKEIEALWLAHLKTKLGV